MLLAAVGCGRAGRTQGDEWDCRMCLGHAIQQRRSELEGTPNGEKNVKKQDPEDLDGGVRL